MEWGEYEESLLQRYEQTGHMATGLEKKPDLLPENGEIVHAFFALCRHRQQAMDGSNPLSFQDIFWYGHMISYPDIALFHTRICVCDIAWRTAQEKKRKLKEKNNG